MYYPLGPLAPDRNPRLNDQYLRVADGVYPTVDGYKPVGQWAQYYSGLPLAPRGGAAFVSPGGVASVIAGTDTTLYRAYSGGWEQIAGGFNGQLGNRWRFTQFGSYAVATNGVDPLQRIDLATLAVTQLGGTPPRFDFLGVIKGFLIGLVRDGDVLTLAWSGAFNGQSWTPGQGQSDYHTMPTGGRLNGMFGGEYGIILQRNRIVRMDYVGGNLIMDPNEVSSNVGCVTPHSVAQWGNLGFFLSDLGFMMWDGAQPIPIGREFIDAEFRSLYTVDVFKTMSTAIDPVRGVVMWSTGDRIYCYDWAHQKWSTIPYASPIMFSGVTKGILLDEQDPSVGALDDDIDGAGLVSLDSDVFKGGDPRLYTFSSGNALGVFQGTPMAATFTFNDIEAYPGRRANLRFARPDIDAAGGLTVTMQTKQRMVDAFGSVASTDLRASGDVPLRSAGRYSRMTVAIAAGTAWNHAKGVELIGAPGAGR
jgi:hypothetical protein